MPSQMLNKPSKQPKGFDIDTHLMNVYELTHEEIVLIMEHLRYTWMESTLGAQSIKFNNNWGVQGENWLILYEKLRHYIDRTLRPKIKITETELRKELHKKQNYCVLYPSGNFVTYHYKDLSDVYHDCLLPEEFFGFKVQLLYKALHKETPSEPLFSVVST
jgi:hypothetical protein